MISARAVAAAAGLVVTSLVSLNAQSLPVAFEVVAATDGVVNSSVSRKPTGWFDLFGAVRIAERLHGVARPLVTRRAFDGDCHVQLYELG
ncbi:MAG: hypothetical protein LC791_09795, partial [Acidobacteria bacterium]|nr:hypothetical protein [Acidobacteriota bacterium]